MKFAYILAALAVANAEEEVPAEEADHTGAYKANKEGRDCESKEEKDGCRKELCCG